MFTKRKVFIFATVIAIPVIIFIGLHISGMNLGTGTDMSEGIEYLKKLDEQDVQLIEHNINNGGQGESTGHVNPNNPDDNSEQDTGLCYLPYYVDEGKAAETLAQLDNKTLTIKELFSDSLFVGDSIITGFDDYHIVNESNVIAKVGARLDKHLEENIETIVQYNPEVLFLHYGLNEISMDESELDRFIEVYEKDIKILKERLPYTKIIVMGLTPVLDNALESQERFIKIPDYNERMRSMCIELEVGYQENNRIFADNKDLYGKDGIHFNPELYKLWMREIVEEMGLY